MRKILTFLIIAIIAIQTVKSEINDSIPKKKLSISFYYSGLLNIPKTRTDYFYNQGIKINSREFKNTYTSSYTFLIGIPLFKNIQLKTGLSLLQNKIEVETKDYIYNNSDININTEKYLSLPLLLSYNLKITDNVNISPFIGLYINELIYSYNTNIFGTVKRESGGYFAYIDKPFLNMEFGSYFDYIISDKIDISIKMSYMYWDIYSFTKQPSHMDLSNIYSLSMGIGLNYNF